MFLMRERRRERGEQRNAGWHNFSGGFRKLLGMDKEEEPPAAHAHLPARTPPRRRCRSRSPRYFGDDDYDDDSDCESRYTSRSTRRREKEMELRDMLPPESRRSSMLPTAPPVAPRTPASRERLRPQSAHYPSLHDIREEQRTELNPGQIEAVDIKDRLQTLAAEQQARASAASTTAAKSNKPVTRQPGLKRTNSVSEKKKEYYDDDEEF